jgi:hypothetical protein
MVAGVDTLQDYHLGRVSRPTKIKVAQDTHCVGTYGSYVPIAYRYSTNDFVAPSMPCTFGLVDSMT